LAHHRYFRFPAERALLTQDQRPLGEGNDRGVAVGRSGSQKMRVPRKVFSRLTGLSERALADWENGRRITEPGLRRIKEIDRFQERLAEVVDAGSIPEWSEKPNPVFGYLKPLEVIDRGEIDRLWSTIFYLESGVAS
jgi:hypothetical protein